MYQYLGADIARFLWLIMVNLNFGDIADVGL
jgi:hypothetical protein